MDCFRRLGLACGLIAILVVAPGCLVRRRVIATAAKSPTGAPRKLITVTRAELIHRIQSEYDAIRSFNTTVDMTPSLGSVYKGQITEYKDIRAFVVFRRPAEIRIIGLYPVVRSKAFDMVSNGQNFRIFIPSKNRFIQGVNDAPPVSKNSLENLRPEAFLEAMLVPPPQAGETPLLIDNTDEEAASYILVLISRLSTGELIISRDVTVDRTTLLVSRQKKYDTKGNIISDTRYSNWKAYGNGANFPSTIDINRPEDGYGVVMGVVKLDMNSTVTDDKFVLQRPEGTQLQEIGAAGVKEPGK